MTAAISLLSVQPPPAGTKREDVSMSPQNAAPLTMSFRARTRSRQMLIAFPAVNIKRVCCRDLFSFVPRAGHLCFLPRR